MGSLALVIFSHSPSSFEICGVSFYIGVIYIKRWKKKIKDMYATSKPVVIDWWVGKLQGLELGCVNKGTEYSGVMSKGYA